MTETRCKASRRRRLLRFSLGALLLLMIPVGIGSVWVRDLYMARMPIDWKPFSTNTLADYLKNGQPVLVHFGAGWDPTSAMPRQTVFETDAVRRAIRLNTKAAVAVVPPRGTAVSRFTGGATIRAWFGDPDWPAKVGTKSLPILESTEIVFVDSTCLPVTVELRPVDE